MTHVLLTGVTGFLGQAVLERLLFDHPDAVVTVLARGRGSMTAEKRVARLLRKPVMKKWREQVGNENAAAEFDRRVAVVSGGLGSPLGELVHGPIDVVVHSASTVSFDPPIDEAFETNVGGAEGFYEQLLRSTTGAGRPAPHVIHVSTAYVGGASKGMQPEAALVHDVDWREELSAARGARERVEAQSREPEILRSTLARATSGHGKVGPRSTARVAEEARKEWVRDRLSDYGSARAESIGWTDVYTLTKALSERIAEEKWAASGHRLSVVRPSIIESAAARPFPGWIDGFKVADPLILAYGRGLLPDFPGSPDSILDLIPVDHVVGVISTLVATEAPLDPDQDGATYFQVASGKTNPLPFHKMVGIVRGFFVANPLTGDDGTEIAVPTWRFPGGAAMLRRLKLREGLIGLTDRGLSRLPASSRTRGWVTQVHRAQSNLKTLRMYVNLYRAYTKTEMIFDDRNTRRLFAELSPEGRRSAGFDITSVDWDYYMNEVHFPAIMALTGAFNRRTGPGGASRGRGPADLPRGEGIVAVFDLDGTVVSSNLVTQYLALQRRLLSPLAWPAEAARIARDLPTWLIAERRDRGAFIRAFMRNFAGMDAAEVRRTVAGSFGSTMRAKVRPEALRLIAAHREAGHRTVLVTGAADLMIEPLAELFDEVVAGRMDERDGRLTGYLATPPMVDEARAAWLLGYAGEHGLDLARSYGYGDSQADVGWLSLVGKPSAVEPDLALYRAAKKNRWDILEWAPSRGPLARRRSQAVGSPSTMR